MSKNLIIFILSGALLGAVLMTPVIFLSDVIVGAFIVSGITTTIGVLIEQRINSRTPF